MRNVILASDALERGGALEVLHLLARHLPHDRFALTVALSDVTALDSLAGELEADGVAVRRLAHWAPRDPLGFTEFRGLLAATSPDLIHLHLPHPGSCRSFIMAAGTAGRPVVTTEHDPVRLGFLKGMAKQVTLRETARTIVISDSSLEFMRREYGLNGQRVVRIWNGIEPERFRAGAVRSAELQEYRRRAPLVLCVATLQPHKGVDVLLEALREVVRGAPQALLLVVGDGPAVSQLRGIAAAQGVTEHVCFLGWRTDVPDLLATCDVLAQPSRRETFGLAVVEAMAAGRAVVATRVGGHRDTVEHDATGLLVPSEDPSALAAAILSLTSDPSRRATMGAAGQARVAAYFTAERMASETAAVYESLLTT